jgi:hypothetical protein
MAPPAVVQDEWEDSMHIHKDLATSAYTFVAPPVLEIGSLGFVAQFTGDSRFSPATSNTVGVRAVEFGG